MIMNNISIDEKTIKTNAQNVILELLTNKHTKKSKTTIRIKTIYTEDSVSKMATNLFKALNNRQPYEPVSDIFKIKDDNDVDFENDKAFKDFCINLFTDDLRRKNNNIYDRLKLSKNICQFCHGKPTNALDHYFDKKDSYELAIFPDNLIPICTDCNSKKGTRTFVYPYLLILQSPNWLECTVNANKTFAFSISKNVAKNSFENKILTDLQSQFDYLNIFSYYVTSGQAIVTENISAINQLKRLGFKKEAAKDFIENNNRETKKILLQNTEFYKIAILNGIISNFDAIWTKL
ncbi:HNH endonuclease [Lactiplantibacillus plantarum]|uniref:HNH endonuclease n=1 Tax=Lactiplantibacillus plantarum TaxID=1590 RepID=UPI001C200F04|nr:HNH endonuclease [Lactiplantibacillus plantarum]MCK8451382.1 hypothetical protein [Lactiplantibacillus plantarum]